MSDPVIATVTTQTAALSSLPDLTKLGVDHVDTDVDVAYNKILDAANGSKHGWSINAGGEGLVTDAGAIAQLASILAKLSADPATQTTAAAILAKLSADPATQTTLAAVLAKLSADPATQTTLAAILAKLPAALGGTTSANSLPVVLSSDGPFAVQTGSITETAPATDTASSGLNGRLQRIAQRLSSLITALGSPFQAGGSIGNTRFIADAGTNLNTSALALDSTVAKDASLGSLTETAPATDTASSGLNGRLQRIAQRLTSLITALGTPFQAGGSIGNTTFASTVADGANVTLGAKGDAKSTATDTTAISAMSVWKQISASIQAAAASLSGTLTVGTHAVTVASRNVTPSWTDGVAVTAITTLAKGAVSRSTIDLTGKHGMYLSLFIGRTGTTALDVGIAVRVNRQLATNPIIKTPGAPVFAATSDTAAAVSGVAAASGNNAGVTSLTLNAAKTFVAGTSGDIILAIIDNTATPTTATEFVRQSVATSTTVKLLDAPTISAHNSTSHVVSDKSNVWQAWIEGGCVVEVIFDYGAATTGDTVVIGAYAQRLDSMVSA